jgi:carbonic anhydrase/acetyltransferase-like protein (isoleucine patch superfamily)
MTNDPFKNYTIASYLGKSPIIDPTVFLCDGVRIIGDVVIGKDSSIWFNSVVRGDVFYIRIGERTNIQDNCTLHVTHDTFALTIGNDVTVGHSATLHGCTIHDNVLIGMGATVLDDAVINSHSLIAAGSVVLQKTVVPEGMLVAGVPAKVIRPLTDSERADVAQGAKNYMGYVRRYRQAGK